MNPQDDKHVASAARFAPEGAMTVYEAAQHKEALLAALEGAALLEVDLGAVREFDTAGLQLLLLAWREAGRTGRGFVLQGASGEVAEVMDHYQLGELLQPAGASPNRSPIQP